MVYVDCADMVTVGSPERAVDETPGPETAQLFTWEAFQEMVDVPPECTRAGFAPMKTSGCRTVTVSIFEFTEELPATAHVTW